LARTREKIVAAAESEFAAKGLAGARVDAIARHAGVNKQMLYYCFGSKLALYREIVGRKIAERSQFLDQLPDLGPGLLAFMYDKGGFDSDFVRMLQWEALDFDGGIPTGAGDRRALFAKAVARVRNAQRAGKLPRDVDPRRLFLALIALTVFPLAFPQLARMATGASPTDPKFRREQSKFLKWIGSRIAAAP
jgi:AcrR family transcriptional regulator